MSAEAFLVNAGEPRNSEPLAFFGDEAWVKVSGSDTDGRFAVLETSVPPQGGPPSHRHSREDEWFYILAGTFVFEVDGDDITASAGGSVFAPRGTTHTFQNIGSDDGRMIIVSQPAGIEAFLTEISRASRNTPVPDMSVLLPIFAKYGIEFMGPPLSARAGAVVAEG